LVHSLTNDQNTAYITIAAWQLGLLGTNGTAAVPALLSVAENANPTRVDKDSIHVRRTIRMALKQLGVPEERIPATVREEVTAARKPGQ